MNDAQFDVMMMGLGFGFGSLFWTLFTYFIFAWSPRK